MSDQRPVPNFLTRSQVTQWLGTIGIDPHRVPRGAVMHLGPKSIDIEVYATDDDGKLYPGPDGKSAAMDRISIPIVEAQP